MTPRKDGNKIRITSCDELFRSEISWLVVTETYSRIPAKHN